MQSLQLVPSCMLRKAPLMTRPLLRALCLLLLSRSVCAGEAHQYLTGTIGTDLAIQMTLTRKEDGSLTGSYFYERYGTPLLLTGKTGTAEAVILSERPAPDQDPTGQFRGTLTPDGLSGTWTSPGHVRTLPVKLTAVADWIRIETAAPHAHLRATYPYVRPHVPGAMKVNAALHKLLAKGQVGFLATAAAGVAELAEEGLPLPHIFPWEERSECTIQVLSPALISLLITSWTYAGGAHGSLHFIGLNWHLTDGQATPLHLADLFPGPDTRWQRLLLNHVTAELKEKKATAILHGQRLELSDMAIFTLSPRGLSLWFAPYAVGSYAEGPFTVTLPLDRISEFLPAESPVRHLLADRAVTHQTTRRRDRRAEPPR